MGQTKLPPQIPQIPLPLPPLSKPLASLAAPCPGSPGDSPYAPHCHVPPHPCPLRLSPTGELPHCGAGRQQRNTGRHGREDGNRDGDRVWGEVEPHLGWGPAPQGRHGPHSCASPMWGAGGTVQWGGPAAQQGQGSTYSTGSCERAEAFPAPPGRHTGERQAGEGCLLAALLLAAQPSPRA